MTATIEKVEIEDCFFSLGSDTSKYSPGWVIAKLELPFSAKTGNLYLVLSILGEKEWVEASKVKFRTDGYEGFESEAALKFDWSKYKCFKLPEIGDKEKRPTYRGFRRSRGVYH